MPTDHPDGTVPTQFTGADLKVPVDIQAQYITLEMDIIAQTVGNIDINLAAQSMGNIDINLAAAGITLDINIAAQAANVDVNLAASAVTITVSVTGTADIQITAQSVGVYLKPDWEAKEGHDKFIRADGTKTWNNGIHANYTVPAGKTLYVIGLGVGIVSSGSPDYDHFLYGYYQLTVEGIVVFKSAILGGHAFTLDIPIVGNEGEQVSVYLENSSDVSCNLYASMWGYEI